MTNILCSVFRDKMDEIVLADCSDEEELDRIGFRVGHMCFTVLNILIIKQKFRYAKYTMLITFKIYFQYNKTWCPRMEEVEVLYQRLKNEKVLEFQWKCQGRRNPYEEQKVMVEREKPVAEPL